MWLASIASVAASLADTWGSDLGQVHQSHVYDILSARRVMAGYNGGVSALGFMYSFFGALLIAIIAGCISGINIVQINLIMVNGLFGSIIDSILGSLLQEHHKILSNTQVNLFSVLIAGILTVWTAKLFGVL